MCETHLNLRTGKVRDKVVRVVNVAKLDDLDLDKDNEVSFGVEPRIGISIIPYSQPRPEHNSLGTIWSLQAHEVSDRREVGGGDSLERHEKLVLFGIVVGLNHGILGVGYPTLDRRYQFYSHFRGARRPVGNWRASARPGTALRQRWQRCVELHSSFSQWFNGVIVFGFREH